MLKCLFSGPVVGVVGVLLDWTWVVSNVNSSQKSKSIKGTFGTTNYHCKNHISILNLCQMVNFNSPKMCMFDMTPHLILFKSISCP